jgi:uncharacterized protein YdaU (DUF1376 family)
MRGVMWWCDRWRGSSAFLTLTLEEQGCYRNLLDVAALRGGPLPNDDRVLANACGDPMRWPALRTAVLRHFYIAADGQLHNETLDFVLGRMTRNAEKQRRYREHLKQRRGNAENNEGGNGRVAQMDTRRSRKP